MAKGLREIDHSELWVKQNEESLIRQSRSFAIPILNLDHRFKNPVMVEYNLNKTIDTIEDSVVLSADEKIDLIHTFCEYLLHDGFSQEVKERMLKVTPDEEAYVFKNYESTIGLYNILSEEEKNLAKKWTKEMAEGMCLFLKRPINTSEDLNDYCYYVAGTVGIYLTNLLKAKGTNVSEKAFIEMENNAASFGLFLQKLNVIRDFEEDRLTKKRSFWPNVYFEREKDRIRILNTMCYETLKNDVPGALVYVKNIPQGNESYEYFIRFIFSSGIEYLKILKDNNSVFSKLKVKLPKIFIKKLYGKVSSLSREAFIDYCKRSHEKEMDHYNERICTSPIP